MANFVSRLLRAATTERSRVWRLEVTTGLIILFLSVQIIIRFWPPIGIFANISLFVILLVTMLLSESLRRLALGASVLPLATMAAFASPVASDFVRGATFAVALLTLGITYLYMFSQDEPKPFKPRPRQRLGKLWPMLLIGAGLGLVGAILLRRHFAFEGVPLFILIISCLGFATAEEIVFRGLVQKQAIRLVGADNAVWMATALYVIFAITAPTFWAIPFALFAGFTLANVYGYTGSLVASWLVNVSMKLTYILCIVLVFS